ncbi:MAG: response regulator [Deltaproteobacteria bacterium]|nr:response regulator [Deltaproteobacteria bacterium]
MNEDMKILLADDEKVVRDGCCRVLEGKGYHVWTAENGQFAIDILKKEEIDIILLDLKMPVIGGEEVLEWSSVNLPDIPVIIITGHGTIDQAVECMKKGAYDFVTKPFRTDEFLITVARARDKRLIEQRARLFEKEHSKNLYDLNLEKSRLKTIINCMANGVMVANLNMELVLHNPALMRLLEIKGDIDDHVALSKVINHEALLETLRLLQSKGSSMGECISQELRIAGKCLRAISAPAVVPAEGSVGTVTVLEDITAFKKLDEMKSDFVDMVAHELRSPLVSIRQQNSILLEGLAGPLGKKQEELIGRGMKKIDQLLSLISELLDISRMEAGQHIQRRVPTDVEQVINDIIALIGPRAMEKGIKLSFICENLKPIYADPKGIEEIFNNLITNAINYSPDSGSVRVSAIGQGEYIEIKVSDTGVGIEPEELPKIFDKFYRIKHPKTRQVMGSGLGLSIVKAIVDFHHGTIDVKSEPDKGTIFRILLPAIKPDE